MGKIDRIFLGIVIVVIILFVIFIIISMIFSGLSGYNRKGRLACEEESLEETPFICKEIDLDDINTKIKQDINYYFIFEEERSYLCEQLNFKGKE